MKNAGEAEKKAPPGMEYREQPCARGPWAAGCVLLAWALVLPMANLAQIAICLAAAAAAWILVQRFGPKTQVLAEATVSTGSAAADEAIREGRQLLAQLAKANDAIPGKEVSAQIDHICRLGEDILQTVSRRPATVGQIRRFLNYYLPTLVKLLEQYQQLNELPEGAENIRESKQKIEELLGVSEKAFARLLDALHADQNLNIAAEIEVMSQVMNEEGLGDAPAIGLPTEPAAPAQPEKDGGIRLQF